MMRRGFPAQRTSVLAPCQATAVPETAAPALLPSKDMFRLIRSLIAPYGWTLVLVFNTMPIEPAMRLPGLWL